MAINDIVVTGIRNGLNRYHDSVVKLAATPDAELAELSCLEGRAAFGMLFPDWEEFIEVELKAVEAYRDDLAQACAITEQLEPSPESDHALGTTRCRLEAVQALLDDGDLEQAADKAVAILGRMIEFTPVH